MPRKLTHRQKEKKKSRKNYPMHPALRSRQIDDSLGETDELYPPDDYGEQYFSMRPTEGYKPNKGFIFPSFTPYKSNKPTSFTDYKNPMMYDDDDDESFEIPESDMDVYHPKTGETTFLGGKRRKTHKKKYHKKKSHKKKSHKKKSHKKRHTRKSKKSRKH